MNSGPTNHHDPSLHGQLQHNQQMKYQAKEPPRPAQLGDLWGQPQGHNTHQQQHTNSQPQATQYVPKQQPGSFYPTGGNQYRGPPAPQPPAPSSTSLSMSTPAFTPDATRNTQPSFYPTK